MNYRANPERNTQRRVIQLFSDAGDPDCLGYRYLGSWADREQNSNIEEGLLRAYLQQAGYAEVQITKAIDTIARESANQARTLYENNQVLYGRMRYGVSVKTDIGSRNETVQLINWDDPEKNDWVIVEEVTLEGDHNRRPDLVLYLNGLAIAVIELKTAGYPSERASGNCCPTSNRASIPGFSRPCSSCLRAMTRRACSMAPSEPLKNTSSNGRRTRRITCVLNWITT
jgi:type I site-specific restriction-modification system R (restriction) subunit